MSLKTFVELPDTRRAIDEVMHFPKVDHNPPIKAEPRSLRYALVGTAFDYILRFMIQRENATLVSSSKWVANMALEAFLSSRSAAVIDVDGDTTSFDLESSLKNLNGEDARLADQIQRTLEDAKVRYRKYLSSGQLEEGLVRSSLMLAKLDFMFRSGLTPENFDEIAAEDLEDLVQLAEIVPIGRFKAKRTCVLNPTFGEASRLVAGADGDLFIDGTLIDFKTTKSFQLRKDRQRQIVGYVVLATIGGIGTLPSSQSAVVGVGYYASRFGELVTYAIDEVLDVRLLAKLAAWFRENPVGSQRSAPSPIVDGG